MQFESIALICIATVLCIAFMAIGGLFTNEPTLTDPEAQRIYACSQMSNVTNIKICIEGLEIKP